MTRAPASRVLWASIALVLATFIWASTFSIVRTTITGYNFSPFGFLFWRFLVASVFAVVYFFPWVKRVTPRGAWAGFVCGGFLFVGFAGQTLGLAYIPAARSAFLTGLFVLIVPYLAWLTLDRPLQAHIVLAAALAAVGLFFITRPTAGDFSRGDLYTLLCAVAFAGQIVALEEACRIADYRELFVVQLLTVLALSAVCTGLYDDFSLPPNRVAWFSVLFTALLATVLGFAVQAWAQQIVPASEAALMMALEPVFTLMIGALVYHEYLDIPQAVGATLILAGILVVTLVGVSEIPAAARDNRDRVT